MLVPDFWKETLGGSRFPEICKLSNSNPHGILGISAYSGPDEIYYYIAAATDKPVPEGMYEFEIPAATWVVFESNGYFKESVQTVFKRFLTDWLPFSGYEYAMLPDIEVYPISEQKPNTGNTEVWIAVIKERENEA